MNRISKSLLCQRFSNHLSTNYGKSNNSHNKSMIIMIHYRRMMRTMSIPEVEPPTSSSSPSSPSYYWNNNEMTNIIRPYYKKQQPIIIRNGCLIVDDENMDDNDNDNDDGGDKSYGDGDGDGDDGNSDDYDPSSITKQKQPLSINAINKWKDWNYLQNIVNEDTICRVEIGGGGGGATSTGGGRGEDGNKNGNTSYGESANDIRFVDYIQYIKFFEEQYGTKSSSSSRHHGDDTIVEESMPSNEHIVYMAQNDIFPELTKDYAIPKFCYTLSSNNENESSSSSKDSNNSSNSNRNDSNSNSNIYQTMIWIGPYGCISPTHYDPLDNTFMQFVGMKKFYLFQPNKYMYCGQYSQHSHDQDNQNEQQQYNTSPINPEEMIINSNLIKEQYPLFYDNNNNNNENEDDYYDVLVGILKPGDVLYIPKKWYHYVKTIETSISVNVWWR